MGLSKKFNEDKMSDIPTKLDGSKIYIQKLPVTFEFAKQLFDIVEVNRNHILPWLDWALPEVTAKAEDEYNFALFADEDWQAQKRFEFAIFKQGTTELLGGICLMRRNNKRDRVAEIGYWLKKEATGHGYMLEAVSLLEKFAYGLGYERLVIRNDVDNIPSKKVAEKAGFTFEGIERHGHYDQQNDKFVDINVFSKLRDEI